MTSSELGRRGFHIDGEPRHLIAAEFQYFRHDPQCWGRILDRIRDAGIEIVSSFIAWDFHEVEPGRFDFTGETHPARDLSGFIDLCREQGFLFFARPGPFIDAEWETRGPAPDVMKLDRLHPGFLERAKEWVGAVSGVLAPAQVTAGGPIAAVGLDNEITYPWATSKELHRVDGDVRLEYDADYHDARFRTWLSARYETLAELNEALGTELSAWDDVAAPLFQEDPPAFSHEGFTYINDAVQEYVRTLRRMYTDAGIDVPVYTNQFQLLGHVEWSEVDVDSVGMNLFMPDRMPGDASLVANWWCRLHFARFDYRWAAEFQQGWVGLFEDFGFLSPEHSEYMPMAAQAAGLRGLSFFMFVERDDWAHSPVNALGKVRPDRYERVTRVVASYRGIEQIDSELADVGLVWALHDHAAIYLTCNRDWSTITEHTDYIQEAKGPPAWWVAFRELADADVDFRFWIPGVSPGPVPRVLVHAGLPCAPADHVERLAGHVTDDSCDLIEVTPIPVRDLRGREHEGMRASVDAIRAAGPRVATSPSDLPVAVAQAGAPSYARTGHRGVWSYAHRDTQGSTVLGIWNPLPEEYHGPVQLADEALPSGSDTVRIEEPRLGSSKTATRAECRGLNVRLEPTSARVFRLSSTQSQ